MLFFVLLFFFFRTHTLVKDTLAALKHRNKTPFFRLIDLHLNAANARTPKKASPNASSRDDFGRDDRFLRTGLLFGDLQPIQRGVSFLVVAWENTFENLEMTITCMQNPQNPKKSKQPKKRNCVLICCLFLPLQKQRINEHTWVIKLDMQMALNSKFS